MRQFKKFPITGSAQRLQLHFLAPAMPRSGTNAESAEDHMAQLRRQVEQKKLDAMRQRLLDKQETLMHMQNNNLPSGSAGHATDEMSRFAHEQLNRVHAAQERLLSVASSEPVSVSRSALQLALTEASQN